MPTRVHATTILAVRRDGRVALGGDGQVTIGDTVVKHDARKVRRLGAGHVLAGFAGAAADALTLLDRFEKRLEEFKGNTQRAAVELAKDWRTDRYLRRLESFMIVADEKVTLILGGSGDVIEPTDGVAGIGAGAAPAVAAARALLAHSTLPAARIVEESLRLAGSINIYTNEQIAVEEL